MTYKPIDPRQQAMAYKQLRDQCITRHLQACLTLKQFEYITNVTDLIDSSYQVVKRKFLQAIDYVADTGLGVPEELETGERKKRNVRGSQYKQILTQDLEYLRHQLVELAAWSPTHNKTNRVKRIVNFFVAAGAAIGARLTLVKSNKLKETLKSYKRLLFCKDRK